ncbi:MAG: hypothetical protein KGI57_06950 [Hyphomicrobiales bacterium]|nr:hypothetical protein [Hyphomicrobiales bacterium]MDE2017424.1 hypothetical protein [Hyphomicrobiales bacterium]
MAEEPEDLVLALLREMRGEMKDMRGDIKDVRGEMATKAELADLRPEMKSGFAAVAADIATLEKQTGEKIVGLPRAVIEYRSAVLGHGILISEFEARLRRLEQHVNLPERDAH